VCQVSSVPVTARIARRSWRPTVSVGEILFLSYRGRHSLLNPRVLFAADVLGCIPQTFSDGLFAVLPSLSAGERLPPPLRPFFQSWRIHQIMPPFSGQE